MTARHILALCLATLLSACATVSGPATVADTIARDPQLSTLNGLVQKAGLADTLRAAGPYTVFAPTNDAFGKVPARTLDELGKDPARLKDVLSYHVLPGKVSADQVKNGNARTAQGANVALARAGAFVTVEDAMVQTADIAATNGVVHTVDRVLMPPAPARR
jgi:uncharacterized surface protein with fasciclin (FAS1) repeats